MVNTWFIIVNPIAGNLKFSSKWSEIQLLLDVRKINYSFAVTLYSRHEVELVKMLFKRVLEILFRLVEMVRYIM